MSHQSYLFLFVDLKIGKIAGGWEWRKSGQGGMKFRVSIIDSTPLPPRYVSRNRIGRFVEARRTFARQFT